ncbi:glycosyltransferase [Rufibacter sp. LB8]|uniref:glycosyltransferase n=1 Tax=Rufibacter sp. LB8 TaxID=2777781 RepID=UPI00178C1748|nr:glycosyltransferase [Rufibacter sp. LB8]
MQERRKNILLLIPTFTEGGAQKMVFEIGKILAEKYNVFECSYDAFGEPHVFKNSNKILSLNSPHGGSILKKLTDYPKKISRLRDIKREYSIDITISNLWSADLVNILSGADSKTISIGHISIKGNFQNRLLLKLRKFVKLIYNRFDKVIAVNEALMTELGELFEIPKGKIGFINNFIAYPEKPIANKAKLDTNKRLVTVGRLNPIKNQAPLLYIYQQLKSKFTTLQLVIIGNGPLEEELKNIAKSMSLRIASSIGDVNADIVFTGFVNPYTVLSGCDIFVFPSKSEGLPLVMLEAMNQGLPVIASDCPTGGAYVVLEGSGGHQPDRVDFEETKTGFLMPIPDADKVETITTWEHVIKNLLDNQEMIDEKSRAAMLRSLEFSVENIKTEWYDLIEEVCQK